MEKVSIMCDSYEDFKSSIKREILIRSKIGYHVHAMNYFIKKDIPCKHQVEIYFEKLN